MRTYKAKTKSNDIIDLNKYQKGSDETIALVNLELFCEYQKCKIPLVLCSYRDNNLPLPYFRAKNRSHIPGCKNIINSDYDPFDLTARNNGVAAFNKILKYYDNKDNKKPNLSIYNKTSRTVENFNNDDRQNAKTRVKTGPIIYDGTFQMEEDTTYLININDLNINFNLNKNHEKYNYLNIASNPNIGIPLQKDVDISMELKEYTLIIFIKGISIKNDYKYVNAFKMKYLLIKNDKIIYKKIHNIKMHKKLGQKDYFVAF